MKAKLRLNVGETERVTSDPQFADIVERFVREPDKAEIDLGALACDLLGLGPAMASLLRQSGCEVVMVEALPSSEPGVRILDPNPYEEDL